MEMRSNYWKYLMFHKKRPEKHDGPIYYIKYSKKTHPTWEYCKHVKSPPPMSVGTPACVVHIARVFAGRYGKFKLPLLNVHLSKEECKVFDRNISSFLQVEDDLVDYRDKWIIYNSEKNVIDSHENLNDGWLFLLQKYPNDRTSLITIPGKRTYKHQAFTKSPISFGDHSKSMFILDENTINLEIITENDEERGQTRKSSEERKKRTTKYIFHSGSPYCSMSYDYFLKLSEETKDSCTLFQIGYHIWAIGIVRRIN